MKKQIDTQSVYEKVRETLDIGVRQNRLFIKGGKNWTAISAIELAITIRSLYREEEQKLISSGTVKEVIERLLQNPSVTNHHFKWWFGRAL